MVGLKVFARRALIVAGALGFFGAASLTTHEAVGAAVTLGWSAMPR